MAQITSAEESANQIVAVINEIAKANVPLGARLGYVLSVSPLKIACDNLVLDENDLWADAFLLSGYQRSTEGTTNITGASGEMTFDKMTGDILVHLVDKGEDESEEEG